MLLLLSSALNFKKNSFRITIRVSDGLDPYWDQGSVRPDLGLNCLQRQNSLLERVTGI